MPHSLRAGLLAAAMTLGTAALAFAEVSEAHRAFIEQVAMGGHEEVAASRTAAESENPEVAAFGRRMVDEHTRMNEELARIAKSLGITPPDSPSLTQQAKTAATGILPGATFDRTYINTQVEDHEETLALMRNEAANGTDPQLGAFAQKAVRSIEQHLAEATKLQREIGEE
jgi:putative membrane protein